MPALAGILQTLAGQQDADDPDADMKKQLRDLPQLKQEKREELDYLFRKMVQYQDEAEAMGIGMCMLNFMSHVASHASLLVWSLAWPVLSTVQASLEASIVMLSRFLLG